MLITINGPYKKYNQSISARVKAEIQKLYPDIRIFPYNGVPSNELDKMTCMSTRYNPFLHISSILTQMAIDIEKEEDNKSFGTCMRDFLNIDSKLVIATEWYSSAIIRVLSQIIQYQPYDDSTANLAKLISTKDKLVDFAFTLIQQFQFIAPDLNIIFMPNENEMYEDMSHRITNTKTLSKTKARHIKECYANYMNLLTSDSHNNIFTRNGESFVPIYIMNRPDVIIPTENPITTSIKTLVERYNNFNERIKEQECNNVKTQTKITEEIVNIIKSYVDVVYKPPLKKQPIETAIG